MLCFYTTNFIFNLNHQTMKRYQPASAFLFLALLVGPFVSAQEIATRGNATAMPAVTKNFLPLEMTSTLADTYPGDRLRSRFMLHFPDATRIQWRKLSDSYYVSFEDRGRKGRAVFTPEGQMNYAITNCRLEGLPEAFRSRISQDYSNYTLLNAVEIRTPGNRTYQAILENATGYVTLKGVDGSVEVTGQQKAGR
jgi:hypothetical protein